ncbi:MAG: hypothetical protein GEU73_16355 [Chloroflexi bacterium]|nr:hypothetical protein [Chloroflexota bacterium]
MPGRRWWPTPIRLQSRFGMKGSPMPDHQHGVDFDQKTQLDQVAPWILDGERLYAVYDCKSAATGFIAITSKRLIFYDKAFMRKRKALTSVPFSKITSVSSVDEGRSLFGATSELVVKAGPDTYKFEFRGGTKAQRAYQLIMGALLWGEPSLGGAS